MKTAPVLFLALSTAVAAAAACGPATPEPVTPPTTGSAMASASTVASGSALPLPTSSAPQTAFVGPMKPIAASAMMGDLAAIGIDLKNAPPLGKLEPEKLRKVMKLFAKALGAKCADCHADDMAAPTPRKKVAEKMWNEFVLKLTMMDGSPIFCDTCHQGRFLQLDRHDKKVVSAWMDENFTDKLKRKDKKEQECASCHGDPPEFKFLDDWRK